MKVVMKVVGWSGGGRVVMKVVMVAEVGTVVLIVVVVVVGSVFGSVSGVGHGLQLRQELLGTLDSIAGREQGIDLLLDKSRTGIPQQAPPELRVDSEVFVRNREVAFLRLQATLDVLDGVLWHHLVAILADLATRGLQLLIESGRQDVRTKVEAMEAFFTPEVRDSRPLDHRTLDAAHHMVAHEGIHRRDI